MMRDIEEAEKRVLSEFDSGKVINLKIGIDAGQTLARIAQCRRKECFWGIEVKPDRTASAVAHVERLSIDNCIITSGEAKEVLRNMTSDLQFDVVHIYFPTPYPNALRNDGLPVYEKLLSQSFLSLLEKRVRTGGELRVLTDLKAYHEEFEDLIDVGKWWALEWTHFECGQRAGEFIGTPCERKYSSAGDNIYANILRRL